MTGRIPGVLRFYSGNRGRCGLGTALGADLVALHAILIALTFCTIFGRRKPFVFPRCPSRFIWISTDRAADTMVFWFLRRRCMDGLCSTLLTDVARAGTLVNITVTAVAILNSGKPRIFVLRFNQTLPYKIVRIFLFIIFFLVVVVGLTYPVL